MEIILRYVGQLNGQSYLSVPGVPARDLTEDDIKECGKTIDELMAYHPPVYELIEKQQEATDGR